ncbi:aminoacyl-tRNA hydrolase [Gilvimarinus sp. F26214L]|uniref:aminoacyl-tRNA hydrolase n=1 Tax=Gilvimarinus sp. DZF01 TaxID=3461371 RepID=UPI0040466530
MVGLGNPGPEYQDTRHNAGAILVEEFARRHRLTLAPENKFSGLTGRLKVAGEDLRLLIPTTYMNRSGQAVAPMVNFFKIPPEEVLVVHDEIDLPPGTVRFKKGGGAGGNNGLKDIIRALGNNNGFKRLRIGVGHPGSASQVAAYVLRKAPADEYQLTQDSIERAIEVLPTAIAGDWEKAMRDLHTAPAG